MATALTLSKHRHSAPSCLLLCLARPKVVYSLSQTVVPSARTEASRWCRDLPPAPAPTATLRAVAEDLAKALALAAVLLPGRGVLERWALFAWGPDAVSQPVGLALATSPADLIGTGAVVVLTSVVALVVYVAALGVAFIADRDAQAAAINRRIDEQSSERRRLLRESLTISATPDRLNQAIQAWRRKEEKLNEDYEAFRTRPIGTMAKMPFYTRYIWNQGRAPRAVIVGTLMFFSALSWMFNGPFPGAPIAIQGALIVLYWIPRIARRGTLSFYRTWPLVILLLTTSAIGAGLNGNVLGNSLGAYQFSAATGLAAGSYAEVGQDGDLVYLLELFPLGRPGRSPLMRGGSLVVHLAPAPPPGLNLDFNTSLLGLITGRGTETVGLGGVCSSRRRAIGVVWPRSSSAIPCRSHRPSTLARWWPPKGTGLPSPGDIARSRMAQGPLAGLPLRPAASPPFTGSHRAAATRLTPPSSRPPPPSGLSPGPALRGRGRRWRGA